MTRHEALERGYYRLTSSVLTSVLLFFAPTLLCSATNAQAQLVVTYGAKGVQTLTYNGTKLEDVGIYPGDAFHMAHLQCTDLQGNPITDSSCTWGETNRGESWNSTTNTETYTFPWGTIATQFVQSGNNLNIVVTETNYAGSGKILGGVEILALALHFPQDPLNFQGYNQYAITTTGPAVVAADYGTGVVTAVIPDESTPLYGGWGSLGNQTYNPGVASAPPDNLAPFFPQVDSPVQPGSSFTFTVSLRFTPEGAAANAQDGYSSFAAKYPSQMTWIDKRIIGTAYLASSPSGNINQPGGYPTNPRRYFNDPSVDITTPSGLQAFQDRILAQAANDVINAQNMKAQGVITWDIEGEEYPQTTSYVCSPDQIAAVAPEMESIITDSASPYHGKKLDDSYFATMSSAGLRLGVCLRPQVFTLGANSTASQVYLSTNAAIIANLENKARYANTRWGVTLFYVDSTVESNGETLDPAIFEQLITDFPNFLFIPEESTPRYYAYSAPFYTFIFHTDLGTPASIYNAYPAAFGANLVNDVSAATLAQYQPQLTQSVVNGDILMGHADYWQANDPTLVQIYANAAAEGPKTLPVITWPTPAAITQGTALSAAQLDASANVAGTFVYTPAAGTVLSAGSNTLNVTFTPTDTKDYRSQTASVSLTVNSSAPSGAAIVSPVGGASVSGTITVVGQITVQLDAAGSYLMVDGVEFGTARVTNGPYLYPLDTTKLSNGQHVLQLWAHDTSNNTHLSAPVTITVANGSTSNATITWPTPAAITYGTALSATQLDASANVAGTFTYTPAAGTVLGAGNNTLNVSFTPTDTTDYKVTTSSVSLSVSQAIPVITWATPAAITQGTALSATQLDATANVPGTFVYTPAAGTVLSAGSNMLNLTFTPADTTDYKVATSSVSLSVTQAATGVTLTWPTPAPITYGTALSATQLDATANVAGTFVYTPAAGTVLTAGSRALNVTFTPTDTTDYKVTAGSVTLTVNQATPIVTWATPAAIAQGTALSAAQLDATANVPGTFGYTPAAGTVLPAGGNTLSVTFTPTDTTDYTSQTASVSLTVNSSAPSGAAIVSPVAGASVSGTITVVGQITVQLDAAGSYLMVDGVEYGTARVTNGPYLYPLDTTKLSNGQHTLQLWAHDTSNNTHLSAAVTITVANGSTSNLTITWPTPAAITYGTALSATQLDASANVPGTFAYTPAAGTVLSAGSNMLNVTFTPTDTTDYKVTSSSVTLSVGQATPVIAWATPAAITQGTALSATQLDATANVPGTFAYTPAAGTVLSVGSDTLIVTFTPTNTTDYTSQTANVSLTVTNSAPTGVAIVSPVAGASVSGTITVVGQITVQLDAAGSYLMVDGVEFGTARVTNGPYLYQLDTTRLSNGQHTLQLWAHDTGNNTHLSAAVTITVAN
jgi:hypothetical protein